MPKRLPDDKRAAILADIEGRQLARNAIARKHGVSVGTVSNIANEAGLTDAFDRAETEKATKALIADTKALRAEVSRRFLEKANQFLDQIDEPHLVFSFGGKDNTYNEHVLDRPPTVDLKNLMTSAGIAFDKHIVAERHDAEDGLAGARDALGSLGQALMGLAGSDAGAGVAGESGGSGESGDA